MVNNILNGFIALSFFLVAVDSALSHVKTKFNRREMWIPVYLAPAVIITEIIYIVFPNFTTEIILLIALAINVGVGLLGSYYHFFNEHTKSLPLMKKLIYGPPVLATLQITGLALLGMIFVLFL